MKAPLQWAGTLKNEPSQQDLAKSARTNLVWVMLSENVSLYRTENIGTTRKNMALRPRIWNHVIKLPHFN